MTQSQWNMKTNFGSIFLVASDKGLQSAYFQQKSSVPLLKSLDGKEPQVQILKQAVNQLEEYFSGQRTSFDLPLDTKGTDFQRQVWGELLKIPYGQTYSYQEIAKRIRNEKAVRAVGAANGRNPVSIIVPCHRVVNSGGGLGGYSGGLDIKAKLLDLEKAHVSP